MTSSAATGPAEIVFDHVSKSFARGARGEVLHAVRDLNLTVHRGELVALLGKTGCGKSTTFNLLSGITRPTAGKVRVKGHDPYAEFNWFRGKIGIVFQNDRLMPWRTARENVAFGLELNHVSRRERFEIADHWLQRLGLNGHENDYPHALSGGMRQRVSIARAFALRPDILLCDEPFSALDEVTGDRLRNEFSELVREINATSIFVTHSIAEALQLGRRIVVFRRPARIAYETVFESHSAGGDLAKIRADILRVLADDSQE